MTVRTLRLLMRYRSRFITALVVAIVQAVFLVSIPVAVSDLSDILMAALTPGVALDADSFWRICGWLSLMVTVNAVAGYVAKYLFASMSNSIADDLRRQINDKVDGLPIGFVEGSASEDVVKYISVDSEKLSENIQLGLGNLILAASVVIACIVSMLVTEWRLALITIAFVVLGQVVVIFILRHSKRHNDDQLRRLEDMTGAVNEFYAGRSMVQVYRDLPEAEKEFEVINDGLRRSSFWVNAYSVLLFPTMNVFTLFGSAMACLMASWLYINGEITFGVFPAFLLYVTIFSTNVSNVSKSCSFLQVADVSMAHICEFLETEEEGRGGVQVDPSATRGEVEFRDVVFGYADERPVIRGMSFHVEPGTRVALVGETGCGKSTIINILLRFYDVQGGEVLVDGVDVSRCDRRSVRSMFTVVPQDPWVFNGTLRENILFNSTSVSDEELLRICEATRLTEVFPESASILDERISSGRDLSYGQRQMISVARAMARRAPMVLLDEATSAMDSVTEQKVTEALDELTRGKTSFTVAHRLSTIMNADRILVIGDGRVLEDGTHDELMRRNGRYAELFRSQFKRREETE